MNIKHQLKLTSSYDITIRRHEYVAERRDREIFVDVFHGRTWHGEERAWYWARQDCRHINEGPFGSAEEARRHAIGSGAIPDQIAAALSGDLVAQEKAFLGETRQYDD